MKKPLIVFLYFLLCLNFALPLYSEESNNKPVAKLDLSDAINVALDSNISLLKQKESNNIYKLRAKKEFTYFLPDFVAASDYAYNSEVGVVTSPGSPVSFTVGKKNTLNTSVSLVQPISDIYKTSLKHKIATEKFNISLLSTELQNELIIDLVSKQYFDLIKQKEIIELNKQNIKALEAYYKVAKDHYDAGISLARDYMKIQIEIDNAKHRLLVEENKYKIQMKQFKELLGVDLNDNIQITGDYEPDSLEDKQLDELQQIAIDNRPEVQQLTKSIDIEKLNKRVQIAEYIPHVNFFVSYVNQVGSEFLPDNKLMFGVNARYDFWQWNRKYLSVKEQQSEIKTKELDLKELIRSICIEVESQLNTVEEARNLIDVSEGTVNLAEESLRITSDRYFIGLALITDLLDDQTALLDSQVKLVTSKLEYQKSLIDLDKTIGILKASN